MAKRAHCRNCVCRYCFETCYSVRSAGEFVNEKIKEGYRFEDIKISFTPSGTYCFVEMRSSPHHPPENAEYRFAAYSTPKGMESAVNNCKEGWQYEGNRFSVKDAKQFYLAIFKRKRT